jgi:hypothetical protein
LPPRLVPALERGTPRLVVAAVRFSAPGFPAAVLLPLKVLSAAATAIVVEVCLPLHVALGVLMLSVSTALRHLRYLPLCGIGVEVAVKHPAVEGCKAIARKWRSARPR